MESWILVKTNRMACVINALIGVILAIGYFADFLKGRRTMLFFMVFLAVLLANQIICITIFSRDKASNSLKYYILAGYLVIYYIAVFSTVSFFTYVFIFPLMVTYVLYYDVKLVLGVGIISILSNISKVIFQIYHGYTGKEDVTAYTAQIGVVIFISAITYFGVKLTIDINNEKIQKVIKYTQLLEENTLHLRKNINSQLDKSHDIVNFTNQIKELSAEIITISKKATDTLNLEMENLAHLHQETVKVNEHSMNVSNDIQQLNHLTDSLTNSVKMISSIAFSTTLVSFNASIEAARTDSTDRGFTVVAQRIRELASQTDKSTSEITLTIYDLLQKITYALNDVNHLMDNNTSQNKVINDVEESCNEIAVKIDELAGKVYNIDRELTKLSQANQDIAGSIRNISEIANKSIKID